MLIHENKDEFLNMLSIASKRKGFLLPIMEKDYYLTLILSKIQMLSENLVFKGGTCLNKIFFNYHRLSEDLDFSMILPQYEATRTQRRKVIQPVKDEMEKFAKLLGLSIKDPSNAGHNESKQYIYYLIYKSVLRDKEDFIKVEISLRFSPLDEIKKQRVKHEFFHPFTGAPLLDGGELNCLSLNELMAEKLRAASIRKVIAPRDFYDLDFAIRNNFDINNKFFIDLFIMKLKEDGADTDLNKYIINLGRSDEEIRNMRSRIETELYDVLSLQERRNFNLNTALSRINKVTKTAF